MDDASLPGHVWIRHVTHMHESCHTHWSKETLPRGGFVCTMFPHQEPCVRGPPSRHLVQILRGGSSYTRLLMREHSTNKTPPGEGFFRSMCVTWLMHMCDMTYPNVTWQRGVIHCAIGWLRCVGSSKLQVSFAEEPYKRDYVRQKRHIILRSLQIVNREASSIVLQPIAMICLFCRI